MSKIFKKACSLALMFAILFLYIPDINAEEKTDALKWVDFTVTYPAMKKALELDVKSHGENYSGPKLSWIDLLAYLGTIYGGKFSKYKEKDLNKLVDKLNSGTTMEEMLKKYKNFSYYQKAYTAVLDGFVGTYWLEVPGPDGKTVWKEKYGLKAFSPIAEGYHYTHYDDFGVSRNYGFKRHHLGHDLMASIGTPVIAVESGVVEELGWNQYGGWRIGIRSTDGLRYYYYAHLRKDHPYHSSIDIDKNVQAGQVIGYVGRTGYSANENINGIKQSHLHFGIQLVFDEAKKEDPCQIWIDMYAITRLLNSHQSTVKRNAETNEFDRLYGFSEKEMNFSDSLR